MSKNGFCTLPCDAICVANGKTFAESFSLLLANCVLAAAKIFALLLMQLITLLVPTCRKKLLVSNQKAQAVRLRHAIVIDFLHQRIA